jgi:hypothetical protein
MNETIQQTTRVCTKCGLSKPLSDFIVHKVGHTKEYGLICRKCRSGSIFEEEDARWMQQAFTLDKAFRELDIVNEAKMERELVDKQDEFEETKVADTEEQNKQETTEETEEAKELEQGEHHREERPEKERVEAKVEAKAERSLESREKTSGHYKDSFFAKNNFSQENHAETHVSFEKVRQSTAESGVENQQKTQINESIVKSSFFSAHHGNVTQVAAKVATVNIGTGIAAGAFFTKQQQVSEAQKVQTANTVKATEKSQTEHRVEEQLKMTAAPKIR